MRTAPGPNVPPIPGMCPGVAVLAGGADGGGGSGDSSKNGKGKKGAGTEDGDEDASGDGQNGGCAEGDPICPITGRVFVDIFDFGFPGPYPLRWVRAYSSRASDRFGELGYGWSHAFMWELSIRRRSAVVVDDRARTQYFRDVPDSGEPVSNGLGWRLSRAADGYQLRVGTVTYTFGADIGRGRRLLSAVTDRNGNTIRLERDAKGVLRSILDSAGRPYRVTTDSIGRILSIAVATDRAYQSWMDVVVYTYDSNGDLASYTDAEGFTGRCFYDNHLLIEHRSVSGISYCYRYDARNEEAYCIETWGEYVGKTDPALEHPIRPRPVDGPDDRTVKGIMYRRLTYLKLERYCEAENGLGGVTRYFGDATGRGTKLIDPWGGVMERAFDPTTGAKTQESDPSQTPIIRECDDAGAPTYLSTDGGKGIGRWFTVEGDEITFDERNGSMVRRRYDARGNLVFVEHPDGTREEFEYDDRGLMISQIFRNGAVIKAYHDDMGNCVRLDLPGGDIEVSEYDYLGRRIAHMDAAKRLTEWGWDRRNEIIYKKHADGSEIRIERDALRQPVVIDQAGRVTRYEYGGQSWPIAITLPGGEQYRFRYDNEGNCTRIDNPRGESFIVRYDHGGRCLGWTTFEGVTTEQGHDAGGRRAWMETAGARVAFTRNHLGEIATVEAPDMAIALTYSSDGVTKTDNGVVPVDQTLDAFGRVVQTKQGHISAKLAWQAGELAALVADVGVPIVYQYGQTGALAAITTGTVHVRVQERDGTDFLDYLGEGLVRRRSYGPTGLLLRQAVGRFHRDVPTSHLATSADPRLIFWTSYEYDLQQHLRAERRSDGRTVTYELDRGGRILSRTTSVAGRAVEVETLRYDAAGSPLVAGAQYDAHGRPSSLHGETLEYDSAGRLALRVTDRGEWRYHWNSLDQLVLVEGPDHKVELDYDARSRRMKKRVFRAGGELVASISYFWANDCPVHEVNDLTGATRTYIRANDSWELIGHVDRVNGVEHAVFYVTTNNGGIDFAVDESGRTVWTAKQTIYGDCFEVQAGVDVSLRFPNQFYDADVELVYNRMRWYDPRVGLYVSPDPLLLGGTINPRDYAPNPTRYIDPRGQFTHPGPSGNPPMGNPPVPAPTSITNTAASAPYLSAPGHWAVGAEGANGGPPGFAQCPPGAVHQGSGFGSDNPSSGSAQAAVNAAGNAYGCHSCGSRDSGYGGTPGQQHWTCDHQPPRSSYNSNTASNGGAAGASSNAMASSASVRLYPHCRNCSTAQGQALSASLRAPGARTQAAQQGIVQMGYNSGIPI